MSFGPLAVAIAVTVLAIGLILLANSGRAPRTGEVAPNLAPPASNDEMESKRLNKTLTWALAVSAFMAVGLPIYFATELGRQSAFEEKFLEESVHRGEELFVEDGTSGHGFGCAGCHGAGAVGGVATFNEARSGVTVAWAAPSLNDVFYRYSRDEVRYWLVYGRQGTPMPAWGVEVGGPANDQELDDLMNYLESIQITQQEALAQVDPRVAEEVLKVRDVDRIFVDAIESQQLTIAEIEEAPAVAAILGNLVRAADSETNTPAGELTQLIANAPNGLDTDRDGLSDDDEAKVTRLLDDAADRLGRDTLGTTNIRIELDPLNSFSELNSLGEPTRDLQTVRNVAAALRAERGAVSPVAANQESILAGAQAGLEALLENQAAAKFQVDFQNIAERSFDDDLETASRAYGLYSAYCARCHTSGWSAGLPFTVEPGSGALGPSLRDGRTIVQFPDADDHVDFIINGSDNGIGYGTNGIGRGWMPGFGAVLTEEDIRLIVDYERGL
ncbi:MAG: c-type cytochrome [Acidimicrobiia bacterium]|nr:c-type cytochrome [Acidimicrobiia bacterium]NNL27816.1 c-type cytochrome [Acidimicrobiia bacterium]